MNIQTAINKDDYIRNLMNAGKSEEAALQSWNSVVHSAGIEHLATAVGEIRTTVAAHDKRIGEVEKATAKNTADITALQGEVKSLGNWLTALAVPVTGYVIKTAFDVVQRLQNPQPVPVQVVNNDRNQ